MVAAFPTKGAASEKVEACVLDLSSDGLSSAQLMSGSVG